MRHYVYEIVNNYNKSRGIQPYRYIGVRSCECDENNDDYMGSSAPLYFDINILGIKNFSKKILRTFDNRDEANKEEHKLHIKYDVAKNADFYNLSIAREKQILKKKNIVSAINLKTGEYISVTKKAFDSLDFLVGLNKRKIWINNGKNHKLIEKVSAIEYIKNGWKRGKIVNKIQITNNIENKNINPIDLEYYLLNGWRSGRTNRKKHKIWCTNGIIEKMVENNEIPIGWRRGRCESPTKGRICVKMDENIKYVKAEDAYNYEKMGNKRRWVKKDKKEKFIKMEEIEKFLDDGWVIGKYPTGNKNNLKGRICVNKQGVYKLIHKENLDTYISNGWYKGKKQKTKNEN